jgi:hypothetical protein
MSLNLPIASARHPGDDLCRYLRAKLSHAAHGDRRALWEVKDAGTTVYWCLLTMGPAGPDDGLVHAERCGSGRVCCTPAEQDVA